MARATRLTPQLIEEITLYVENGNSNLDACLLAGISESSFYQWLKVAEKPDEYPQRYARLCLKFKEALNVALAKFKQYHVANINTASRTNWQASAWMLERKFALEFDRKMEIVGKDGEALEPVKIYLPDNGRRVAGDGDTPTT